MKHQINRPTIAKFRIKHSQQRLPQKKRRKSSHPQLWTTSSRSRRTATSWVMIDQARSLVDRWTRRLTIMGVGTAIESVSVVRYPYTAPVITIVSNLQWREPDGLLDRKWHQVKTPVSFSCRRRLLKSSTESFKWSRRRLTVTTSEYKFNRNLLRRGKRAQLQWTIMSIPRKKLRSSAQVHHPKYRKMVAIIICSRAFQMMHCLETESKTRIKSVRSLTSLKYTLWQRFNSRNSIKRRRSSSCDKL